MSNIIYSLLGLILTILIVVGVHEFGHFIVARFCGVKVLRFSIGFGKIFWRYQDRKGTEFALSLIPLGGYVKMLNEDEGFVAENEKPFAYNRQPYYKKILIVFAGPFANLLLSFCIYIALFCYGFNTIVPIIGKIVPGSIAAAAGVKPHSEIIAIDQQVTHTWISVVIKLLAHAGSNDTLLITTKNNNLPTTHRFDLSNWKMDDLKPDPLLSLGLQPYEPDIPPIIHKMLPDSPAAQSGLKVGDKILSINGKKVVTWIDVMNEISDKPNQVLPFIIQRNTNQLTIPVRVGVSKDFVYRNYGFLGINPKVILPAHLLRYNKFSLAESIKRAYQNVAQFSHLNFIMISKMLTGKISVKSLGGPISIFESAGVSLNSGFIMFCGFLAFLSISIGIINLVPIPGLDGGHIFMDTIQWITQKPLDPRVQLLFYRFGVIFILLLMTQALINDVLRY